MSNKFSYFTNLGLINNTDPLSIDVANLLDETDSLKSYRNKFCFPTENDKPVIYMNGNSLGLMPKDSKRAVCEQMDKWANRGGEGHVEEPLPWLTCDEYLVEDMSDIVGAKQNEVALMSQLSVNLHLMLVPFYKPTKERYKILCEHKPFPSDHFIFESQIEWHGYNPKDGLVTLRPKKDEFLYDTDDIIEFIEKNGHDIALICLSGVHYLTGQYFDIKRITNCGQKMGCIVGWDLAHTVGNLPVKLHEWNVDFAVWCSYKYLNSGAGGIGGIFVHESHLQNETLPYFKGWWGHQSSDRLEMKNTFKPAGGALKFRISNTSFTSCILLQTSLKIFREIGMEKLREKSIKLTNYFEFLLSKRIDDGIFQIITPLNVDERGSQLSFKVLKNIEVTKQIIKENNILCDCRDKSILRFAPCALYNSFLDVYKVVEVFTSLNDRK